MMVIVIPAYDWLVKPRIKVLSLVPVGLTYTAQNCTNLQLTSARDRRNKLEILLEREPPNRLSVNYVKCPTPG